ncbi:MAG: PIN domain-containing protein [Oscillospiraceae bacterium]|nr:PIN domain-containing protein [Oscillospiraceae bacterium]
MTFAIDSNIISYFLKQDSKIKSKLKTESQKENLFIIPPIVYYEVKRWLLEKQALSKMREFEKLCKMIPIGEMNRNIWDKASSLYVYARKMGKPADDADLLIAAFCVVNDYTLVTNNVRHFEFIKDLKYTNWK